MLNNFPSIIWSGVETDRGRVIVFHIIFCMILKQSLWIPIYSVSHLFSLSNPFTQDFNGIFKLKAEHYFGIWKFVVFFKVIFNNQSATFAPWKFPAGEIPLQRESDMVASLCGVWWQLVPLYAHRCPEVCSHLHVHLCLSWVLGEGGAQGTLHTLPCDLMLRTSFPNAKWAH